MVVTLQDISSCSRTNRLQFEPGSRQQYSNAGYIVLGLLIERLSGENYFEIRAAPHLRARRDDPNGKLAGRSLAREHGPRIYEGRSRRTAGCAGQTQHRLPARQGKLGRWWLFDSARSAAAAEPRCGSTRSPTGPTRAWWDRGRRPGTQRRVEGGLPGGYDVIVLANLGSAGGERVVRLIRSALAQ